MIKLFNVIIIIFLLYIYNYIYNSEYKDAFFDFSNFIDLIWTSIVYKNMIDKNNKYSFKSLFMYIILYFCEISGSYIYSFYIFGIINDKYLIYSMKILPFYILVYYLPNFNYIIKKTLNIIVTYKHCYLTFKNFNTLNHNSNFFFFLIINIFTCKTSIFHRFLINLIFNQNLNIIRQYVKSFKLLLFFGLVMFIIFIEKEFKFYIFSILIVQSNFYV